MYQRLGFIWILITLFMSFTSSFAQDSQGIEVAPLVTITKENVSQLEQWIPLDENSEQSLEWIPIARGRINEIRHSPTDHLIAVASTTGVYLFDTNDLTREPFRVAGLNESIEEINFNSDGTKIVLRTSSMQLYSYTLSSQNLVLLADNPSAMLYSHPQFGDDNTTIFAAVYM